MRLRQYRCFRCKKDFSSGDGVEEETIQEIIDSEQDITILHECIDGGIGIADFVGLTSKSAIIFQDQSDDSLVLRLK